MCIYYLDRPGLNYTTGEHVFPAAIGGKRKLPKDYVSKEFNNDISKLERVVMRNSIVSVAREIEGPGSRGRLGDRHATTSVVHIIEDTNDATSLALGYVKLGRTYEVPHYSLDVKTGQFAFHIAGNEPCEASHVVERFKQSCDLSEQLKVRTIINENLPAGTVLFGIQDGIEDHYDAFFAKHPSNGLVFDAATIRKLGKGIHIGDRELQHQQYMPMSKLSFVFSEDHFRVYAKIAFNFLALIKGKDFVLDARFDGIRTWIAEGGTNHYAELNTDNWNPLVKVGIALPESAHSVLVDNQHGMLVAYVYLYESLSVSIVISRDFRDPFETDGYICDHKNGKEYTLLEYLELKLKENGTDNW